MLGNVSPWLYLWQNRDQVQGYLLQHIVLTVIAVGLGLVISVPLALLSWRRPVVRSITVGASGLLYVIPSLSLFAIIGAVSWLSYVPPTSYRTAEIGLVGYTLLLLLWNTLAGLAAVPDDARDSAIGMGYTPRAAMLHVELPLAVPYILAGVRVATASTIGLVTVTAFVGLGGLGQLFIYGFNTEYSSPIIVGLILCVALAAVCDLALVGLGRLVVPWSRSTARASAPA